MRGVLWFLGGWCVCFQLCFASEDADGTMPGVWSGWSAFWKSLGQGCENISVQSFGERQLGMGNAPAAADTAANDALSVPGATGDQSVPIPGYQGKGRRKREEAPAPCPHPAVRSRRCAGQSLGLGRTDSAEPGRVQGLAGRTRGSEGRGRSAGRAGLCPRPMGRPRLCPSPGGAGAV